MSTCRCAYQSQPFTDGNQTAGRENLVTRMRLEIVPGAHVGSCQRSLSTAVTLVSYSQPAALRSVVSSSAEPLSAANAFLTRGIRSSRDGKFEVRSITTGMMQAEQDHLIA